MRVLLLAIVLCLPTAALAAAVSPGGDPARDKAADALVAAAFENASDTTTIPGGGRALFAAVLARPLFLHGTVGPFDVYVLQADGLRKSTEAKKTLQRACEGLKPMADLLAREFPGAGSAAGAGGGAEAGSIAGRNFTGRRFTVVLASSKAGKKEPAFEQLVALLDKCEDGSFSGYKPGLPVFTPAHLAADTVTTWEVALFNVAHQAIAGQDKAWFEHGLGYQVAFLLGSRALYRGASGPVPPWLLQGLADELDIEAHGSAWVAAGESSAWSSTTSGWKNAGWEGFVPEGGHPPPPVTGPPPGNPTRSFESKVASDSWLERVDSTTRHWADLVADLKSEEPVSLAAMAARRTFSPRDRAWARCVLHLLVDLSRAGSAGEVSAGDAPSTRPGLLKALDTESQLARSGLQDGAPLPLLVARVLGTSALDELSVRTVGDFLRDIERPDVGKRFVDLKADALLGYKDLSAQGDWLYGQTQFDAPTRLSIFRLITEIENYRELREWELLGIQLDKATRAALGTSKTYPADPKARAAAAEAFRAALAGA